MTRYEKLIKGTKEDMINEFVLAIKWAKGLSTKDWNAIVNGWGGLEKFVQDVLDVKIPDNTSSAVKTPTGNKYDCPYVHRTYEDRDGPEYWCTLYNKDCDSCTK